MNTLPSLLGSTLSGKPFRIPQDLPSTLVALVFGFSHEARHDVGAWKKFLAAKRIAHVSVPVSPKDVPAEALAPTAKSMKAHLPMPAWESVIQVHEGGPALLVAFRWSPDAFAKVVLLQGGKVRAIHRSGPFTPAAAEKFLDGLEP